MQLRPAALAAVAVGGAAGTLARTELGRILPSGPGLPWGTFVVNVVGAFLLGAGSALVLERLGPSRLVWPLYATGFCGSFTTMSTLAVEVDLKLRGGDLAPGLAYAVVSTTVGLAAVVAGMGLARRALTRNAGPPARGATPRRRPWS